MVESTYRVSIVRPIWLLLKIYVLFIIIITFAYYLIGHNQIGVLEWVIQKRSLNDNSVVSALAASTWIVIIASSYKQNEVFYKILKWFSALPVYLYKNFIILVLFQLAWFAVFFSSGTSFLHSISSYFQDWHHLVTLLNALFVALTEATLFTGIIPNMIKVNVGKDNVSVKVLKFGVICIMIFLNSIWQYSWVLRLIHAIFYTYAFFLTGTALSYWILHSIFLVALVLS